tara:strand:+ start:897 stop:1496 length:600 start_codon:yes stop_codon:yes gene_type:complete
MPLPAALAIPALGVKLKAALAALKGGAVAGKAAKAGMGTYKALSKAGLPKGIARFAGDKVNKLGRGLTVDGFKKNLGIPMTKSDIAMTVAPDLLFGGFAAATTEGDLVDKALAGAGSAVGGVAGGVGLRGVLGPKSGLGILGTELVGGMVGDQIGYGAAESLIRAKHGGMTPAEQQMAAADEAYKRQLYDQFLAEQGLA